MNHSRNGWKPQLVALDVDGTLLRYDDFFGKPAPSVVHAVQRVSRAGSHVCLATGRALHSAIPVMDALGLTSGYAVCSNGAVLVDVATRTPIEVTTFDVSAPVRHFMDNIPDALLAVEELGVGFRVTGEFPAEELDGDVTVTDHEDLIAKPVTRLIVRWPNGDRLRLHDIARDVGLSSVSYAIGYSAWLDIMPHGVSKATGVSTIADRLSVTAEDTLAVGDGHNDVDLLTWAGWGVAMEQSPDDVKAAADEVCGPVESDGLATLLHTYFPPTE